MTFYSRLHCGPSDDFCVLLFHGQGFEHDRVFTRNLYMFYAQWLYFTKNLLSWDCPKTQIQTTLFNNCQRLPIHPIQLHTPYPKKEEKANLPVSWQLYPQVTVVRPSCNKNRSWQRPPKVAFLL